jgi:hypothetical protein
VLIAADVTPQVALPVRRRVLTVGPAGPPRLESVDPAAAAPGATLVLRGSHLLGPVTGVRVGRAVLEPAGGATDAELQVVLDDTVGAGLHALHVTHASAAGPGGVPPARTVASSNALPLLLRPAVTVAGTSASEVTLAVAPPLQEGQRASVLLGRLDGPGERSFVLPPVPEDEAPLDTLVLPRAEIPDGRWLVRVQVDGVESLPELVGEVYGAPELTLP